MSRSSKNGPAKRSRSAAIALPRAYGSDDRRVLAMLLLPFIVVAFAFAFSQSLRPGARPLDLANVPYRADLSRPDQSRQDPVRRMLPPSIAVSPSSAVPAAIARVTEPPAPLPQSLARAEPVAPLTASISSQVNLVPAPEALAPPVVETALLAPAAPPPSIAPAIPAAARPLDTPPVPGVSPLASAPLVTAPVAGPPEGVVAAALAVPDLESAMASPSPLPASSDVCVAEPFSATRSRAVSLAAVAGAVPRDPADFGAALASAALSQTREFVVYNDKYRRIAYPMGDVPSFYGVCTDVLIRAYRTLSIDLQALVQQTRMGSGDPNIDHRRVDTLRRFFAAHGQSMPITEFAEDYRPGDIVSYWRPQNRHSRTHIAIVANEIGPSGRPMIIHNRGWGPQLEDGLFVDQITGHYRFMGMRPAGATAPPPATAKSQPPRRPGLSRAAGITRPLATTPAAQ